MRSSTILPMDMSLPQVTSAEVVTFGYHLPSTHRIGTEASANPVFWRQK
ncbi:hypothetical protein [Escherichia coli]|nr:hypothetical protein [Escherichia coli]WJW26093.1 hypothetical protein QVM97_26695 [Escherichia coli]